MDKSSIENKIKARLIAHEESIDNDSLFEALGIEEKPKKRKYFWLFFLGTGLLLASIYFIRDFNTNEQLITTAIEIEDASSKTEMTNEPSTNYSTENINENTKILNEISKEEINTLKTEEPIANESASTNEKSTTNTLMNNAFQNQEEKPFSIHDPSKRVVISEPSSNNIERTKENRIIENGAINSENATYEKDVLPTNEINDQVQPDLPKIGEIKQSNEVLYFANKVDDASDIQDAKGKTNSTEDLAIYTLKPNELFPFEKTDPVFHVTGEIKMLPVNQNPPIVEKLRKESKWSINPYIAYDQFNKSLVSADPAMTEYLNVRSSSENSLEGLSAGLTFNYSFSNGLYAGIGVEFIQYNSQFDYSEFLYAEESDSNKIVRINYVGDSTIFSNGLVAIETERKWETFNELQILNVPILVGYEYQFNKFGVFAEAGMQIGVYSHFTGKLYDSDFVVQENPNFYKRAINVSAEIGAGVNYMVNSKSRIFTKIRFRNSLTNIASFENPLQESISQVGIVAGYRMNF